MKVLSLFDGVSCGRVALDRAGVKVGKYFASEIDKHAIQVSGRNFPDIVQLGDVTKINAEDLPKIDLVLCGFPCQSHSTAGKQGGFKDPRGQLFFDAVRILNKLKEVNPDIKFLFENVKMKKESAALISETLGVEAICIDSSRLSAQSRNRLYWTNIKGVDQPKDKGVLISDILEKGGAKLLKDIPDEEIKRAVRKLLGKSKYLDNFSVRRDSRGRILVARPDGLKIQRIGRISHGGDKTEIITCFCQPFLFDGDEIRKVTPLEAERLQTLPDGFTEGLSQSHRYKAIGNGWTVDVIAHILKNIHES